MVEVALFDATYFFIDDFNRKSNRAYQIEAVDAQGATTHAQNLADELQPLLQCGLVRFTVSQSINFPTVIIPGANIDEGLTTTWELSPLGSEKLAPTTLPGPVKSIFDENGNLLTADPLIISYAALFANGAYRISDGEQPVDLKRGKLDR